jgi:hypothetical protein
VVEENVALPLESVPVPKVVVPSLKVTVPLGLAPKTVAVRVTDWPKFVGLGLTANVLVLVALLTVRLVALAVLDEAFLESPP